MNEAELKALERILTTEEEVQPMTGFSTRVMRAVREEAEATAPIAFPWARFLPGFLLNAVLLITAVLWMILELGSDFTTQTHPTIWPADQQAQGLLWAALAMVGSSVLAWAVSRWVAPKQTAPF